MKSVKLNHDSHIPVVFISGPSGVGKSTLLRQALSFKWPDGLEVKIPKKYTTRDLRAGEKDFELIKLSTDDFKKQKSKFLVSYEDYGRRYGLEAQAFEQPDISKIYIQTMPTSMAMQAKLKLKAPYKVFICRLEQKPEVIVKRLVARGDKITLRQMVDRAKGISKLSNKLADADLVLKTDKEPSLLIEALTKNIFI